jgi:glycosyltransferase involved in cell wall biosynthesis
VDLSALANLNRMTNTPDPRDFYQVSRVVLMPSLWRESLGRVATEAMANGIPVLASWKLLLA